MKIEFTKDELSVLAEVVEWAESQLDMDSIVALAYLKDIKDKLPEVTDRVIV